MGINNCFILFIDNFLQIKCSLAKTVDVNLANKIKQFLFKCKFKIFNFLMKSKIQIK